MSRKMTRKPTHPGEIIKIEYMETLRLTLTALAGRYNRTVRYDWLNQHLFTSITEVQEHATQWLWIYNNERHNMALGGITPKQKLALVA